MRQRGKQAVEKRREARRKHEEDGRTRAGEERKAEIESRIWVVFGVWLLAGWAGLV